MSLLWYLTDALRWSIIVRVCCTFKKVIRLKHLLFSVHDLLRVATAFIIPCFLLNFIVPWSKCCLYVSISLKECRSNTPHPAEAVTPSLFWKQGYCSLLTLASALWHRCFHMLPQPQALFDLALTRLAVHTLLRFSENKRHRIRTRQYDKCVNEWGESNITKPIPTVHCLGLSLPIHYCLLGQSALPIFSSHNRQKSIAVSHAASLPYCHVI